MHTAHLIAILIHCLPLSTALLHPFRTLLPPSPPSQVVGLVDGRFNLWDLTQGALLRPKTLNGHSTEVTALAISSDSKVVVSHGWGPGFPSEGGVGFRFWGPGGGGMGGGRVAGCSLASLPGA